MYYRGSLDVDVKVEAYPISNPTDYQMPVRWVPDKNAAQLEVGCNVIARRIRVSGHPRACSHHQHSPCQAGCWAGCTASLSLTAAPELGSLKLEQHATLTCDGSLCICMQVPAQLEETIEDRVHAEEFEFTELQFIKSSRMSKRHLIFACRIRVSRPAVWPDLWPLYGWPVHVLQVQPLRDTLPCGTYAAEVEPTETRGVSSPQLYSCWRCLFATAAK